MYFKDRARIISSRIIIPVREQDESKMTGYSLLSNWKDRIANGRDGEGFGEASWE